MRYAASNLRGLVQMMVLVFAALLAAFIFGWLEKRTAAIGLLALAFVLAVGLFFWEVYSPQYGFDMPWIEVQREAPHAVTRAG